MWQVVKWTVYSKRTRWRMLAAALTFLLSCQKNTSNIQEVCFTILKSVWPLLLINSFMKFKLLQKLHKNKNRVKFVGLVLYFPKQIVKRTICIRMRHFWYSLYAQGRSVVWNETTTGYGWFIETSRHRCSSTYPY